VLGMMDKQIGWTQKLGGGGRFRAWRRRFFI
jgi:hypothetical protein